MDEEERASRALRGRIGGHRLHATHDSRETTRAARQAFWSSFEREVDPDGQLEAAWISLLANGGRQDMDLLWQGAERERTEPVPVVAVIDPVIEEATEPNGR